MKHGFLANLTIIILFVLPTLAFGAGKSVIVGFRHRPGPSERALIHGSKGIIKRSYRLINAMAVRLPEKQVKKLKMNKMVSYVEEDAVVMAVEPLQCDEYTNSWGVWHIGSLDAHASGNKGTGVKIAVIDTGIDYNHEDLDDNYVDGYDFVFDDNDPYDDNTHSHGTHVAGTIAAEDNSIGVTGVAPEAQLYALKVLDGAGFGLLSWVIAAIEWSVYNGMDIANLSLEGPDSQALRDACDSAYGSGVLLVSAGGNTNGGSVKYPAAYDSVIAVTGTDLYDIRAGFSPVAPELELSAPGVDILSTVTGGNYSCLSGTSQAAPHVAGTAALFILSNTEDLNGDDLLNNEDIRLKLQMTAVDLGDTGFDSEYGYGLVNASAAAFIVCDLCYADINNDTFVNLYELGVLKSEFGRFNCDIIPCAADINDDNKVGLSDLGIMNKEFGNNNCCI